MFFSFKIVTDLINNLRKWLAFCSQWVSCCGALLFFFLFFSLVNISSEITWCLSHRDCSGTPSTEELGAARLNRCRCTFVLGVTVLNFPMISQSTRWARDRRRVSKWISWGPSYPFPCNHFTLQCFRASGHISTFIHFPHQVLSVL